VTAGARRAVLSEKLGFQLLELLGEPVYFGLPSIIRERPPGFSELAIDRCHLPQ
jgi:hypothetical protein